MSRPDRVTIHVRPEDLRHINIKCLCGHKSTAEIPEQTARAFNAHICPQCGQCYRVQLSSQGKVKDKQGRLWIVERGPNISQVASVSEDNLFDVFSKGMEKQVASGNCPLCHGKGCNFCQSKKGGGN